MKYCQRWKKISFLFDKNLNFLEYFGQKGVKYYQKKYQQHKMY